MKLIKTSRKLHLLLIRSTLGCEGLLSPVDQNVNLLRVLKKKALKQQGTIKEGIGKQSLTLT